MFILGMGSNVLFKDNTYEGVIIKLSNNFSTLSKLKSDTIAGSAAHKKLSNYTREWNKWFRIYVLYSRFGWGRSSNEFWMFWDRI